MGSLKQLVNFKKWIIDEKLGILEQRTITKREVKKRVQYNSWLIKKVFLNRLIKQLANLKRWILNGFFKTVD